jgi:ribokinase
VAVVGTFTADIIVHGLKRIAEPGRVVYLDSPPVIEPGGHAVNVSISLSKLAAGTPVASIGAVGRDIFAEILERALREWGVSPVLERHDVGTARNAIIVVEGQDRRFHVYRGANSMLSSRHVLEAISALEPRVTYISVGFSSSLDKGLEAVLREARKHSELVYVDPSYTEESSVAHLRRDLGLADVVHLNAVELEMLTGVSDRGRAARLVAEKTGLAVVVTSSKGVLAVSRRFKAAIAQDSFRVNAVDPTGAGDAFAAGFIAAYLGRGMRSVEDLVGALLFAQAAGAAAVSEPGATRGVSLAGVRVLLERQGEAVRGSTRIEGF